MLTEGEVAKRWRRLEEAKNAKLVNRGNLSRGAKLCPLAVLSPEVMLSPILIEYWRCPTKVMPAVMAFYVTKINEYVHKNYHGAFVDKLLTFGQHFQYLDKRDWRFVDFKLRAFMIREIAKGVTGHTLRESYEECAICADLIAEGELHYAVAMEALEELPPDRRTARLNFALPLSDEQPRDFEILWPRFRATNEFSISRLEHELFTLLETKCKETV
jgi:hypothetical protein